VLIDSSAVTNLHGLNPLASVEGDLEIHHNPSLQNLDALIQDHMITDNVHLSTCDVESICAYLSAPAGTVRCPVLPLSLS
jgi:hypothetical protein